MSWQCLLASVSPTPVGNRRPGCEQSQFFDAAAIRPLLDWLNCNGYTVVINVVSEFVDASGHRTAKGRMDVELVVDAIELADRIGQMVLFSGNGDLRPLVEAMQRRGVNVTVICTISSRPAMISDELRCQADIFTDLVELKEKVY
jgi:uncharacterized LabA/DUF88 family protein